MRMKWAEFRFQAALKRSVLHALVKLKQMRMAGTYSDPDNFGMTFRWEFSEADKWQKERLELDRAQFFAQAKLDLFRHVIEKPEREMHLVAVDPVDTANARIKINKASARRIGHIDSDKKTFAHENALRSSRTFCSIENKPHARS